MEGSTAPAPANRPLAALFALKQVLSFRSLRRGPNEKTTTQLPPPSTHNISSPLSSLPSHNCVPDETSSQPGTVFYLAYGSNLSNETFRGRRGIKPLSQVNVQVPSLRLTFDLPGIPYAEPCFANSGRRDLESDTSEVIYDEKSPLLNTQSDRKEPYHKDEWHKGLIGVVYEVTPSDYAHIIATEGGGSSYHDILVDCYPLPSSDPSVPVPQNPTGKSFQAHTLFAPASPPGESPPKDGGRFQRPDTSYAQPSARYLKLITDGAAELGLPMEYRDYLHSIRPYTATTGKQRVGGFIFLSIWLPIVAFIFMIGAMFADEDGRLPIWLREFTGGVFKGVWASYDAYFKQTFGDGERTIEDGGDDCGDDAALSVPLKVSNNKGPRGYDDVHLEKGTS